MEPSPITHMPSHFPGSSKEKPQAGAALWFLPVSSLLLPSPTPLSLLLSAAMQPVVHTAWMCRHENLSAFLSAIPGHKWGNWHKEQRRECRGLRKGDKREKGERRDVQCSVGNRLPLPHIPHFLSWPLVRSDTWLARAVGP